MALPRNRRGDFRREVALFLLDPFAELEADIVLQHDLCAGVLAGLAAMIAAAPMLTDVMVDISATAVANAGALVLK